MRIPSLARFILALALLSLTACGFQMRGLADLHFETLYIQGTNLSITKPLKKALAVNGVKIVDQAEQADLMMETMGELTQQRILSLSGRGRVSEYELIYKVTFRLKSPADEIWGAPQTVEGRRDFSYDDTQLLAKQAEQARLNQDMKDDAVREIMRRLIVQKPSKAKQPEPVS